MIDGQAWSRRLRDGSLEIFPKGGIKMAKAVWTGSLSFGLVNVPVGLYSATEDRSIHFNQFRAGTSERMRNKRVGEQTGDEVAYGDIVKGYDLGGGEYVILTPEELSSVAPGRLAPSRSPTSSSSPRSIRSTSTSPTSSRPTARTATVPTSCFAR